MPTMGKFVAAICMVASAWFISGMFKATLPEGTQTGLLAPINMVIAAILGWFMVGRRAGNGVKAAFGISITCLLATTFWCLMFWALYEMIVNATRLRYKGPMEGITDMMSIAIEHGARLGDGQILGTYVIAMFVVAILPEKAAAAFR